MKKIKKLFTIGLSVMLMLFASIGLLSCQKKDLYELCENEYFIYSIEIETNKINICGFTDKARN